MTATQSALGAPPRLGEHTAAVLRDWLGIEPQAKEQA
jgi:crotonobetainyl-CoA:carnitine CoA-transferase CaiB-like acyl-CoA transferase